MVTMEKKKTKKTKKREKKRAKMSVHVLKKTRNLNLGWMSWKRKEWRTRSDLFPGPMHKSIGPEQGSNAFDLILVANRQLKMRLKQPKQMQVNQTISAAILLLLLIMQQVLNKCYLTHSDRS
jgi:hypothetical protein